MVAVLSTFWLLYKEAMQVSTRVPEAREARYRSLYPPGKISLRSPAKKSKWIMYKKPNQLLVFCRLRTYAFISTSCTVSVVVSASHEAARAVQLRNFVSRAIPPWIKRVGLWAYMTASASSGVWNIAIKERKSYSTEKLFLRVALLRCYRYLHMDHEHSYGYHHWRDSIPVIQLLILPRMDQRRLRDHYSYNQFCFS